MEGIARWCFRHKLVVIGLWLVVLVAGYGIVGAVGTKYSDSFSLPSTDSTRALTLLQTVQKNATGENDDIVVHVTSGSLRDSGNQAQVTAMLNKVAKLPQIASVTSPYGPRGALQISRDGRTAYAQVAYTKDVPKLDKSTVKNLIKTAEAARTPNLQVELGGNAISQSQRTPPSASGAVGVLAAAVVLFIAFGSLLAMSVPLITALVALGTGLSAIGLISHALSVTSFAPTIGALIGLGVGIDYALFIITRYRIGLNAGLKPEEATIKSLDTAGRAVLFAGSAVCVALLGLLIVRISFLSGVGIAAAVIVVISVIAATTLLPALFGVFKLKTLSRKQRAKLKAAGGSITEEVNKGVWARNALFVQNKPVQVMIGALVVIALLIVPFFSLRLGSSDAGNDPASTTTRKAYDLLAQGFGPGSNGPLLLVAKLGTPDDNGALDTLVARLKTTPGIAAVQAIPAAPDATVATVEVIPTTSPESVATANLIVNLRKNIVPAAEKGNSLKVYVGGVTATFADFSSVIASKLPIFLAVIIILGFLILMVAFRSVVVSLTAAVMNILAAGAAFGVLVAVFQWGWGASILHTGGAGPVDAFIPVMMLAILFGLSMDYEVFLVSRMHEEWVHTKDNRRAVRVGQAETGRVITAAASIMILVFGSFIFGGQRVIEEFGLGLSAAVFIDAFVLRNFLVPAIMHLLGKNNWYLPDWLERSLPHLSVEPTDD